MSIFQKGVLLVGIPLLTQAVFLGSLIKIRLDQAEAQQSVLHTSQVITESEHLYGLLAETNSALRGYLITADTSFAAAYERGRAELPAQFRKVADLVPPQQAERLAEVEQQMDQLLAWFSHLHALAQRGQASGAIAEAKTLEGQDRLARLRSVFDGFLADERARNTERVATLSWHAMLLNLVLFGGGGAALLSTALLALVFARDIAGRLHVLAENTHRLAESKDLLPPLHGSDELAYLDRVFRDMAATLAQNHQENEMFVYSVSHDLRSPLVNLQGFSQELALSAQDLRRLLAGPERAESPAWEAASAVAGTALAAPSTLPAALQQQALRLIDGNIGEAVFFIQSAVLRLSGIIDALLRLSRAGRIEYHCQSLDLQAVVERVIAALHGSISAKGASVRIAGPLPRVWGDAAAIEQIFANLIGNAVTYLDPARPGEIEVGSEAETTPGQWVLYVRDNGLGIPQAQQDKVFLAFQRLHPGVAEGEGIGLALVRRVVERHQGRVWLQSAAGVGSTFYVALPTVPGDKQ